MSILNIIALSWTGIALMGAATQGIGYVIILVVWIAIIVGLVGACK